MPGLKDYLTELEKMNIAARMTSAELVDFLCIPVEDMIELLEPTILENLPELNEELQIDNDE